MKEQICADLKYCGIELAEEDVAGLEDGQNDIPEEILEVIEKAVIVKIPRPQMSLIDVFQWCWNGARLESIFDAFRKTEPKKS